LQRGFFVFFGPYWAVFQFFHGNPKFSTHIKNNFHEHNLRASGECLLTSFAAAESAGPEMASVGQLVKTVRLEQALLLKELSIISGKVRHISWAKVLVAIGSTMPFPFDLGGLLRYAYGCTVQPVLRMLGLEKSVEALSSAVVVSSAFVVGILQDTEWLGSLSAALFIVLLLSLVVATIDVDVESLQFEVVNDPTAATQTAVISRPLERRSLFGDNTAPTVSPIKVSFC